MTKIATWNLESAKTLTPDRKASIYDAIESLSADVWILTETWLANHFEPASGYVLAAQSFGAVDLALAPERCWVSIWVQTEVAYTPVDIHAQQDRIAGVRIKILGQADMVVAGTVLPWNSDRLWPGAVGYCKAVQEQSGEWTRIRGKHDGCTFLIAGDFNQSLPGVSRYGSKEGEKALSAELRNQGLICLTPGMDATGEPRIDHICISRDGLRSLYLPKTIEWAAPECNGKPVTDHSGIAVELLY